MFALGQAEKQLGPAAKDFQTVFISVDPARDTPKVLAEYLANTAYPRNAWGLTGSEAEVAAAAKAYHVFYQKAGTGPDYTVNHSTITYLMTQRGKFACVIHYGAAPDEMVQRIKAAMKSGAGAQSC
jgi:protein SCO1/2